MPYPKNNGREPCPCGMLVSNNGLAQYSHNRGKAHREGMAQRERAPAAFRLEACAVDWRIGVRGTPR